MKIIHNIYLGDTISLLNKRKYINRLRKKKKLKLYIIVNRKLKKNLLEIIDVKTLYKLDSKEEIVVVGISKTKEEAIEIVTKIINDLYSKFGNCTKSSLNKFFECI